jgi:hypothetical protein
VKLAMIALTAVGQGGRTFIANEPDVLENLEFGHKMQMSEKFTLDSPSV